MNIQNRREFLRSATALIVTGVAIERVTAAEVISLSPMKFATPEQENLIWGTYGKNGCHYPNVRHVRLVDCDTDHLQAILKTQPQIHINPGFNGDLWVLASQYKPAIEAILMDRGEIPAGYMGPQTWDDFFGMSSGERKQIETLRKMV